MDLREFQNLLDAALIGRVLLAESARTMYSIAIGPMLAVTLTAGGLTLVVRFMVNGLILEATFTVSTPICAVNCTAVISMTQMMNFRILEKRLRR